MVTLEDHMEEVVVLDVLKTNTETVVSHVFQKVQRTLVREDHFCLFLSWSRSIEGRGRPDFFCPSNSSLSVFLTQWPTLWVYDRTYWSKSSDLVTYILTYLVGWPSKTSLFCTLTFDSDLRPACHMKPSSRNHSCRARIFSRSVFLLWHLSSMAAGSKKPIAHPWSSMHGWKCTNSTKKSGWRRLAYNMVCTWKPVRLKFKIVHGWLRY